MTKLKGIDVSRHQGTINWDKVKADGIQFAMIRMGFGGDIKSQDDSQFERNVKECERVGIPWGTYLYSYALTDKDVQSEIAHARRLLKGKSPTFPVAFDMEDADGYKNKNGMPSNSKLIDFCYTWLKALESDGHYVSLYANKHWLTSKLESKKLDRFDKWLAQWTSKPNYHKPFKMWQYTDKGRVSGVSGGVDMNIAYSDFRAKDKPKKEDKPVSKPKPKPKPKTDTYTVVKGDSLSVIGAKLGIKWQDIATLNNIKSPYTIYTGQKLKVKGKVAKPKKQYYTVKKGDSLSMIGAKLNVKWQTIAKLNGIKSPYVIHPGQKLRVK